MKMISIFAATVLLASPVTTGFAASSYSMEHAREMNSNAAYVAPQLTTGRSVSVSPTPLDNCQRGEPSISPNGIAPLSDLGVCHSDLSVSR